MLWSDEPQYRIILEMGINLFVVTALVSYASSKDKVEVIIKGNVIAGIIFIGYLLYEVGFDNLLQIKYRLVLEYYNSNAVGIFLAISSISATYLYFKNKKNSYLVLIAVFSVVILLTGSKKAIFSLVFGIALYLLFREKRKKKVYLNIILVCAFVGLIMYLSFNVDFFYRIIGSRIDALKDTIFNKKIDESDGNRIMMIRYGIEWFKYNPIIGHGVGNYEVMLARTIGMETYSHNNYIELLVGVGIIGFLAYYSMYWFIARKLIVIRKMDKDLIAFAMSIFFTLVIMEIGLVSYYSTTNQLVIALAFVIIRIVDPTKKRMVAIKGGITK
ncbi:O-antigen ligase family protein [Cohnella sp.]|uniref:O-antigen ligase family protein n=1 Tax=Cohnella sp. TaxID=1883426 RepID=UPI00356517B6